MIANETEAAEIDRLRAEWEKASDLVSAVKKANYSPRKLHLNKAIIAAIEAEAAAEKALVDAMDAKTARRRAARNVPAPAFL